jgi:hypothetical protein
MKRQLTFPATLQDTASALGLHESTVRYYLLKQVANPAVDSSGRPLFLERDLQAIRDYRAKHGRKK